MGIFIEIRINPKTCQVASGCNLCERLCPVSAFRVQNGQVMTLFDNEDECILCDLCVNQCPGQAIRVIKQY